MKPAECDFTRNFIGATADFCVDAAALFTHTTTSELFRAAFYSIHPVDIYAKETQSFDILFKENHFLALTSATSQSFDITTTCSPILWIFLEKGAHEAVNHTTQRDFLSNAQTCAGIIVTPLVAAAASASKREFIHSRGFSRFPKQFSLVYRGITRAIITLRDT